MIKTYVKIFFISGAVLFVAIFFSKLLIMRPGLAMQKALSEGILLGAALALVMGTLHIFMVRRISAGETCRDIYSATQTRELESAVEYGRLFAAVTHYLEKTAGYTITESNQTTGRIAARSRFNPVTFGNTVTLLLEKRQGAPTLVRIKAKPLSPAMIVDYGESLKITRALQEHLRAGELR